jgi:UDP-N-acetylglucosamine--N-acetylmuramyl-(pentapeptide) pyrophosphoryl-undecaprenol N-acetylglucosamine transferase
MKPYRFLISGGGTGGHIFPAIAIADALRERFPDAEILFAGADNRMEMERVPAAGYRIVGLPVRGFNRSNPLANIKVIARLLKSLHLAKKILRDFQPDVVVGVGGYAAGPVLRMAASMGIPTLIQEQNSYAGVTNKLLAKTAHTVCVAYEGMERFFPRDRIVITGNPVRKDLEQAAGNKAEALAFFGFSPAKKTVLALGGSLGARTINRSVEAHLDRIIASGVQFIWQTGRLYYDEALTYLGKYGETPSVWTSGFIARMDYAYAAADLVISRAGAGTVSELCLLRKPAILVPSPNVAEDHQTKNALALVARQAALLIPDGEAEQTLIPKAMEAISDEEQLSSLSRRIAGLAQRRSAGRIADEIVKLIKQG